MRSSDHRPPALELGLVLLLGLLWGSPYALTKISLETIPPITLVAGRVALAAAVLWLFVIWRRYEVPYRRRFAGRIFLQGVISCVLPYTLIAFGQQTVPSSLAAILNSTTPLFVCLISVMWTHHEPMTARRVFGVTIGFAGVVAITGASALFGLGQQVMGQTAIVIATMSSALGVTHGRHFDSVAPEVVAAGMLTAAAILLVPLGLVVEAPWQASPSAASLAALVLNAVVATAFGFVIYFRLIRTVGSMGTASTSYLKPAVGVLIGCAFLGEPLTWVVVFGLGAILAGVFAIGTRASRPLVEKVGTGTAGIATADRDFGSSA